MRWEMPVARYESFIVRIWVDETEGVTRGQVQHVKTGDGCYFLSEDKMLAFIMSHLGPAPVRIVRSETDEESLTVEVERYIRGGERGRASDYTER